MAKPTKAQWLEWRNEYAVKHQLTDAELFVALGEYTDPPTEIKKFSDFAYDLDEATTAVNTYRLAHNKANVKPAPAPSPDETLTMGEGSNGVLAREQIRSKYTRTISHYDKKANKTIKRDYLEVAGRILLFRMDHSTGSIITEPVQWMDAGVVFRATIVGADGTTLSTGHAMAGEAGSSNYSGRWPEKAETSAIGRALAAAGYGTDQAGDDMAEGDFIADSPVEQG